MEQVNIQNGCEHNFEFIDCFGTFCTKCDLEYGIECLHPKCEIHKCGKHSLGYHSLIEGVTFTTVDIDMTDDIYVLHLGHDGVTDGKSECVHKVLSYPGLKIVEYCGYYMSDDVVEIFENNNYSHIKFVPIY